MKKLIIILVICLLFVSEVIANTIVLREKEIEIKGKYLLIPIRGGKSINHFKGPKKSTHQILDVLVDGVLLHSPSINLAHQKKDIIWWGQLDMSDYIGKKAVLRMRVLKKNIKKFNLKKSKALSLIDTANEPRGNEPLYKEELRPQLRFSQMRGWNNDSNGMLYYEGEYHFFWQANPVGIVHGNMYWGHAVSTDLIHWKELPEALRPYGMDTEKIHPSMAVGRCHSGGGAIDFNNSGGWQISKDKVLLLTFTDTGMKSGRQRDLPGFYERIAYSTDKGRNWKIWKDAIIRHIGRDPKLFWYEIGKHWTIGVYDEVDGRGIEFYKSTDLKKWKRTGKLMDFYECPEIFEAPVENMDGEKRWVMFGGNGEYVVGDFNGKTMVPEHKGKHKVFFGNIYAGQCFSGAPDGRNIFIGWARKIQLDGMPFNQGFTIPVEFTLHNTSDGLRIKGYPVREFNNLREKKLFNVKNKKLTKGNGFSLTTNEDLADIVCTVKPDPDAKEFVISFGDKNITYNCATGEIADLTKIRKLDTVSIRVVIDRPMYEIFINNGTVYALKEKKPGSLKKISLKGKGKVEEFTVYKMKSIWK